MSCTTSDWLTNSMELNLSRIANRFLASLKIPLISWKQEVYYLVHKSSLLVSDLNHANPARSFPSILTFNWVSSKKVGTNQCDSSIVIREYLKLVYRDLSRRVSSSIHCWLWKPCQGHEKCIRIGLIDSQIKIGRGTSELACRLSSPGTHEWRSVVWTTELDDGKGTQLHTIYWAVEA